MKYHTFRFEIPESMQKYDSSEVMLTMPICSTITEAVEAFERFRLEGKTTHDPSLPAFAQ